MDTSSTNICACGGVTGIAGWKQPLNYNLNEIEWCDCERGQAARRYWYDKRQTQERVRMQQLFASAGIPSEYETASIERLASLNDGEKAAAIAAARELIDTGEVGGKRSLCVIGDYGVGKTYLLSAVLRTFAEGGEGCLWIALAELFREVQRGYGQGSDVADQRIDAACNAGVLLVDDFGRMNLQGLESDDKVRIIDTIINYRHNYGKPTLITSNLTPDGWAGQFGRRTADRVFKMCYVTRMGGQNLRLL